MTSSADKESVLLEKVLQRGYGTQSSLAVLRELLLLELGQLPFGATVSQGDSELDRCDDIPSEASAELSCIATDSVAGNQEDLQQAVGDLP